MNTDFIDTVRGGTFGRELFIIDALEALAYDRRSTQSTTTDGPLWPLSVMAPSNFVRYPL
jgi:hypothetical protein